MIDPVSTVVEAIARGDAARIPLVMLAGAATSFGPCVAPRYVAVAALLGKRGHTLTVATFVGGLLVAYSALGFGAGLLDLVTGHASMFYLALAGVLVVAGIRTLLQTPHCAHARASAQPGRLSGVFSLGAASAFVISPCCTPIVAAVLGMAALDGNPLSRAALLAAFALGHAAPLFAAGSLGTLLEKPLRAWNASPAPAVVSGTLMLALGGYYGLLV
jgi:cytochrome c biogenesis protein CcdA